MVQGQPYCLGLDVSHTLDIMDLELELALSAHPYEPTSSNRSGSSYICSYSVSDPDVFCLNPIENETKSRRRGRKLLRPNDPVQKKTEEKDKFWLRAFGAYMNTNFALLKRQMTPKELRWWKTYRSSEGYPGKAKRYLSYGKLYKDHIFGQPSFVAHFRGWFNEYGASTLMNKYPEGSDLWFVFYNYAQEILYNYSGTEGPTGEGLLLRQPSQILHEWTDEMLIEQFFE